jgi:hypothetical protein
MAKFCLDNGVHHNKRVAEFAELRVHRKNSEPINVVIGPGIFPATDDHLSIVCE